MSNPMAAHQATAPDRRRAKIVTFLRDLNDRLTRSGQGHPGQQGQGSWATTQALSEAVGEGMDRATLFRDIQALVEQGVLEASGTTRSRLYRLNPASLAYVQWDLSRPPFDRPLVGYNRQLLAEYVPNQTRWLSDEQRTLLYALQHPGHAESGAASIDPVAYRRVLNALLIDLAYASSRLEDVNISWLDTKLLIELGLRPDGLSEKEFRIVVNHKEAIQYICDNRLSVGIDRASIFDVHKLLSHGLLGNPDDEGRLRRGIVYFTESAYRPIDNPFVLAEEFEHFCSKAGEIADPLEAAVFAMAFIPYLQPFQDGNKRTSRLCMNIPLIRDGLAPFSFSQIDRRDYIFGLLAFYERGRPEFLVKAFIDAYQRSAPRYVETLSVLQDGGSIGTVDIDRSDDDAERSRPRP